MKWLGLSLSVAAVLTLGILFWREGRAIAANDAWLRAHGLGDLADKQADEV